MRLPLLNEKATMTIRSILFLNELAISQPSLSCTQLQRGIDKSMNLAHKFDPVGHLLGMLLPSDKERIGYFGMQSFWAETGL